MTAACGTVDPRSVVGSLLAVADCQARALGSDGWHGLAASGLFATLLTGMLTLALAREGYRLLAGGRAVAAEDAVRLLIRFGIVIALSTGWQAYDRLIHRVAMDGPAEIGAAIFPSAGVATDTLGERLQNAHDAILTLPEPRNAATQPNTTGGGAPYGSAPPSPAPAEATPPGRTAGIDRRTAATVLLVTGAGSWIAARLLLALLLAVGPLAIAALLFEVSAGLTIGWLRALIGAALATMVIPLSLAMELQMLAGPVTVAVREGLPEIPGLGVIVWSFALVNAALIVGVQRFAGGLALPRLASRMSGVPAAASPAPAPVMPIAAAAPPAHLPPPLPAAPSRALAIARAVETRGRTQGGGVAPSAPGGLSVPTAPAAPSASRTTRIVDAQRGAAAGRRALSGKRLDIR